MPRRVFIRAYVFAAERSHADDPTVPVLAKGKTRTGRLWTYVRDDRPFGGHDPPAAVFFYSPDRGGEHPEQHLAGYAGLMQADGDAWPDTAADGEACVEEDVDGDAFTEDDAEDEAVCARVTGGWLRARQSSSAVRPMPNARVLATTD